MFEANFHRLRSILISLDVNEEEGDKLRNDAWCCFLAASILAVVKIWLIRYTPSSALFADDYDSLNRAIFYYGDGLRASVDNYPFKQWSAGFAYFALISPWVFFDFDHRLDFVFTANVFLSSLVVYFGGRTILALSGIRLILLPLCLGLVGPMFQFSYYVMTENMLFAILACVSWLVIDFENTVRKPISLLALLCLVGVAPITRQPGFAILPSLLLIVLFHARSLGARKTIVLVLSLLTAAITPYAWYLSVFGTSREDTYANSLFSVVTDPSQWFFVAKLFLSQLFYLLFATGVWLLPLLLCVPFALRLLQNTYASRWRNYLLFALPAALLFLGLCLVHMIYKLLVKGGYTDPNPWFPYGRYVDPAVLLVSIGGLAALSQVPRLRGKSRVLFQLVVPACIVGLALFFRGEGWVPVNQCGLSLFADNRIKHLHLWPVVLWGTAVAVVAMTFTSPRARLLSFATYFFILCAFTVAFGMKYTIARAQKVERSMLISHWIDRNVPENATICYDFNVRPEKTPRGVKRMDSYFRAMMFRSFPRKYVAARSSQQFQSCDYILTLRKSDLHKQFPIVMADEPYLVLQVEPKSNLGQM